MYCVEGQGIFLHRDYEVWASFWYFSATQSNKTKNPAWNGETTTLTRRIVNHILTDVHSSSSLLQAPSISRPYTLPSYLRSVFCETNCGVLALFQYLCPAQYVVVETVLFLYDVRCTDPQLNRQHVRSFFTSHLPPCMLCLLYTSPSPRDLSTSRMPSSA